MRKAQVVSKVNHPERKAKHPKVDYAELVRKSQEDYVDFRQVDCQQVVYGRHSHIVLHMLYIHIHHRDMLWDRL